MAKIENKLDGTGRLVLNETIKYMEKSSDERFLSSQDPDLIITIVYGEMPRPMVLGFARPGVVECKIVLTKELDPDRPDRNGYDLYLVLMHEIGHCFGLTHNYDDPLDLMYPESMPWIQRNPKTMAKFFDDLAEIRGKKKGSRTAPWIYSGK